MISCGEARWDYEVKQLLKYFGTLLLIDMEDPTEPDTFGFVEISSPPMHNQTNPFIPCVAVKILWTNSPYLKSRLKKSHVLTLAEIKKAEQWIPNEMYEKYFKIGKT